MQESFEIEVPGGGMNALVVYTNIEGGRTEQAFPNGIEFGPHGNSLHQPGGNAANDIQFVKPGLDPDGIYYIQFANGNRVPSNPVLSEQVTHYMERKVANGLEGPQRAIPPVVSVRFNAPDFQPELVGGRRRRRRGTRRTKKRSTRRRGRRSA